MYIGKTMTIARKRRQLWCITAFLGLSYFAVFSILNPGFSAKVESELSPIESVIDPVLKGDVALLDAMKMPGLVKQTDARLVNIIR